MPARVLTARPAVRQSTRAVPSRSRHDPPAHLLPTLPWSDAVNTLQQLRLMQTRRQFFGSAGLGLGTAALASLLGQDAAGAASQTGTGALPGLPHFAPKAKRVVYLMQGGAPSHVDLFDYKPELSKRRGQ